MFSKTMIFQPNLPTWMFSWLSLPFPVSSNFPSLEGAYYLYLTSLIVLLNDKNIPWSPVTSNHQPASPLFLTAHFVELSMLHVSASWSDIHARSLVCTPITQMKKYFIRKFSDHLTVLINMPEPKQKQKQNKTLSWSKLCNYSTISKKFWE